MPPGRRLGARFVSLVPLAQQRAREVDLLGSCCRKVRGLFAQSPRHRSAPHESGAFNGAPHAQGVSAETEVHLQMVYTRQRRLRGGIASCRQAWKRPWSFLVIPLTRSDAESRQVCPPAVKRGQVAIEG